MDRNKIKIIEFGMDDDEGAEANTSSEAREMKIIEFDNDPPEPGNRVASAVDVKNIKIIEFDDDRKTGSTPSPRIRTEPAAAMKIKEFDKDATADAQERAGGRAKIKIVEFD